MRECAAAFIVKDNFILLGKRSSRREFYPDVWDVFGGHRKSSETIEDALRRELREELGIVLMRWKFLLTVEDSNFVQQNPIKYHIYLITAYEGEPENLQPEEHEFIRWCSFEEALNLPFAHPLYVELIGKISEEFK